MSSPNSKKVLGLAFVLLFAIVVGWAFHDQFWAATDDGNYGYVALRMTEGDVLYRDIQDIHAGYINFVNALAIAVFGPRFVGMRYPLIALSVVQAALVYWVVLRAGVITAVLAGIACVGLGVVQFLNPAASWYVNALAVAVVVVLDRVRSPTLRAGLAGVFWSMSLLFRQLSGILLGLGILVVVLGRGTPRPKSRFLFARSAILLIAGAGLTAYLIRATGWLGATLFGLMPVVMIGLAGLKDRMRALPTVGEIGAFGVGALVGGAPLAAYLTVHSVWSEWYRDAIVTAVRFPSLAFFDQPGYLYMLYRSLSFFSSGKVVPVLNGVLWLSLLLSPLLLGGLIIRHRIRFGRWPSSSLPLVALFLGLTAVHFQIPIYLFYASGPIVGAILLLTRRGRVAATVWIALLSFVALRYQAGQPLERNWPGVLRGDRIEQNATSNLPWMDGLRIPAADARRHERVAAIVRQFADPEDPILVVPGRAEIYLITNHRSSASYFNTALGLMGDERQKAGMAALRQDPPTLIALELDSRYWTAAADSILAFTRQHYRLVAGFDGIQFFQHTQVDG